MNSRISEHLKTCIGIELASAELYTTLGELFPEGRKLFRELMLSEENHANVLMVAYGIEPLCEMPMHFPLASAPNLQKIAVLLEKASKDIDAGRIGTLRQALRKCLEMEELMAEGYLHDLLTSETNLEVIKYLKQFYKDEQSHSQMIKDFMEKLAA